MKHNKVIPSKNEFIRKRMYRQPVPGSKTALLGSLILLIYVFSELLTRYDAVDGMWQAYFRLVEHGDITVYRAIQNLWETPEARKDLLTLAYLGSCGIIAFISCMSTKSWKFSALMLPVSCFMAFYSVTGFRFLSTLNITEYIKLSGCVLLFIGSVFKIGAAQIRKTRAELEYSRKTAGQHNRRGSTLVPKRIQVKPEKR